MTKKSVWDAIDVTATVCMTVASVALLWDLVAAPLRSVPTVPGALVASGMVATDLEPGSVLAIDESSRGVDGPRIALIEFSDFECPYCAAFAGSTLSVIRARYIDSGRVAFVYRHMPSERVHPHAMAASMSTLCADEQGQFWPVHDWLFSGRAALVAAAEMPIQQFGLDAEVFQRCLRTARQKVREHAAEGRRLGVSGPPRSLLGDYRAHRCRSQSE